MPPPSSESQAAADPTSQDGPGYGSSQTLVLLAGVFVVAGCGLAYELIMGTAAAYFLGDTVLQFSITIGVFLSALGLGAALSRRVRGDLLRAFVLIEVLVAAVGGVSAALIYLSYGWSQSVRGVTIALPLLVGVLVGLELPILARLLARGARLRVALSNVLSFDYLGGLATSLAFPLLLLPGVGLVRSALVFGLLNASVALVTAILFRARSLHIRRLVPVSAAVLVLLVVGFAGANTLVAEVEKKLTGGDIVASFRSRHQRAVLTRRGDEVKLFLDGHLQFSSRDEARYHETLAHPAMAATPERARVLVIGGGDGLLLREILRYPEVERVTVVDIDEELVRFCRTEPLVVDLNRAAFEDRRVEVVAADAFVWLQTSHEVFDRIFVDLPDPRTEGVARIYSVELFRIAMNHLDREGVVAVQAVSPYHTPRVFWSIAASLEAAGFDVEPAHVNVPSFGEWGFLFGSGAPLDYAAVDLPGGLRFLTPEVARGLFTWPLDMVPVAAETTHFDRPVILRYYAEDTRGR